DYKTESKEIPGYKLVEKPKNAEGKYEEGTKEVIYVYEKVEGNVSPTHIYHYRHSPSPRPRPPSHP
ncbi:MucBP domain-containing protein, partial [Bacillus anthracis]|uniref:MucBP domain-containing protein n=1 Tax=Bacillus anthracis TaxID=1392 RepID=UPI003D20ED93